MSSFNPIYLLADSQLLFWKHNDTLFLRSLLKFVDAAEPSAAYIGAANGDQEVFYEIFVAAMEGIGIQHCHMIRADFSDADRQKLEAADVILLAGGDVKTGWDVFVETGIKEIVQRRYSEGAVLIGVSAGAVQLGTCAMQTDARGKDYVLDTFQILPFIVDVHAEQTDWRNLKKTLTLREGFEQGIGIPTGAGVVYHPDHTVEPVRYDLAEFTCKEGQLTHGLICPKTGQAEAPLH
ncbi:peptidase [Exilibacterium tricleocarpae]|uniref:Peptidase n=1 Tax=Exilibacterium tricleocarpae TaxID=2591008 RepID=A0A545TVG7_9GAMM|nr:Type 1 glutamine amidotransferase-like domain-containing protein [Exilibacterium tricleocarpae]TQV81203.1 peptidase [Exilibacterium tricleocarpae]